MSVICGRIDQTVISVICGRIEKAVILCEKGIKSKLSGNEVYYTACSLLVILKNSCRKFHCQKVLI